MKNMTAALAAMLMMNTPVVAQTTAGFTLREWSSLNEYNRKVAIVAAIEGLMLASSTADAKETGLDPACIATLTFDQLETGLQAAAAVGNGAFVDKLVEVGKCSQS